MKKTKIVCRFAQVKKTFFSKSRFSCWGYQKKCFQSEKRFFEKSGLLRPPPRGVGRGQKNIFLEKSIFVLGISKKVPSTVIRRVLWERSLFFFSGVGSKVKRTFVRNVTLIVKNRLHEGSKVNLKKQGVIGLRVFTTVGPTPNTVDLGVCWDDLSIEIIKTIRFSCYLGGGEDHMKRSHFVCLFICLFRGQKRFFMVSDS